MTRMVNLTPHAITFVDANGNMIFRIPATGQVARLSTKTVQTGVIEGIPITETQFGEIEGLPDPEEGTIYVVSSLVAGRCKDRKDVFVPNESVRDNDGRIVGCRSLGRI